MKTLVVDGGGTSYPSGGTVGYLAVIDGTTGWPKGRLELSADRYMIPKIYREDSAAAAFVAAIVIKDIGDTATRLRLTKTWPFPVFLDSRGGYPCRISWVEGKIQVAPDYQLWLSSRGKTEDRLHVTLSRLHLKGFMDFAMPLERWMNLLMQGDSLFDEKMRERAETSVKAFGNLS